MNAYAKMDKQHQSNLGPLATEVWV